MQLSLEYQLFVQAVISGKESLFKKELQLKKGEHLELDIELPSASLEGVVSYEDGSMAGGSIFAFKIYRIKR